MKAKNFMSISEARKKIFMIADEVQKQDNHYTLTENGKPKVVVMSVENFESLKETIEVMWDFPNLRKDIEQAERDFKSGKYKKYTTLDELLNTKTRKRKYGMAGNRKARGKKRH